MLKFTILKINLQETQLSDFDKPKKKDFNKGSLLKYGY